MIKSARKSETETLGIVGRFHRFEDLVGKRVYVIIGPTQHTEKTKQNKTKTKTKKQNKTKAKQSKAKQSKAKQSKAKQSKAKQSKTKQNKQKLAFGIKRAKRDRIYSKQTKTSLKNEISIARNRVNKYRNSNKFINL